MGASEPESFADAGDRDGLQQDRDPDSRATRHWQDYRYRSLVQVFGAWAQWALSRLRGQTSCYWRGPLTDQQDCGGFASEGRGRCIARLCAVRRSSEVSGPENYERAGGPAHRSGSRLLAIIAIVTVGNQEVPETLEETVQVVPEDGKVGRPSTLNMCEVSVVMSIAERFFKSGARLKDMGVISPYTGHNAEIKKAVAQFQKDTPSARETLDVGAVDAFQGKEENIVICSTVRCSTDGSVGHVADLRRLTVALTRARQGLVNSLLCKSPPPRCCLRDACSLL